MSEYQSKDRNLARDGRVSLCVEDGYRYVTVRGELTVDDDPASGQATIRRLAERYHGAERAAGMMADEFSRQQRLTLRRRIDAVDAHGFGGEG